MINMGMNKEISILALQMVNNSSIDDAISAYFILMETNKSPDQEHPVEKDDFKFTNRFWFRGDG